MPNHALSVSVGSRGSMKASYLSAILVAGAYLAGCRSVSEVRPPSRFPYPDDISFRGFAEEALYGYGTQRTHLFDDYTKGSYHVHPREVAEGLFKALESLRLVAPSDSAAAEEDSCVVFAQTGELHWSRFGCSTTDSPPEFEQLEHTLERLMKGLEITYSGYPPIEESDDP